MRTVNCTRLGQEAEGLDAPPFGGPIGLEIFENVSKEAWSEWLEMQTKIINEYRLDLSEREARDTLMMQMRSFLKLKAKEGATEILHVGTPN